MQCRAARSPTAVRRDGSHILRAEVLCWRPARGQGQQVRRVSAGSHCSLPCADAGLEGPEDHDVLHLQPGNGDLPHLSGCAWTQCPVRRGNFRALFELLALSACTGAMYEWCT